MKVISVSGRKGSGKSVIADIATQNGYKILKFADGLKDMVAEMFEISRSELEELKEKPFSVPFHMEEDSYQVVLAHTGFPDTEQLRDLLAVPFTSIRHILQYLGTDVIRLYNVNWHIEKLKSKLTPNGKFIVDDTRFPNEIEFMESLGAYIMLIERPGIDRSDEHSSETSLDHYDFPTIVINDQTLEDLQDRLLLWMAQNRL